MLSRIPSGSGEVLRSERPCTNISPVSERRPLLYEKRVSDDGSGIKPRVRGMKGDREH